MSKKILEINNLSVSFPTRSGNLRAVDDVSLSVGEGEIVGIVGESGSGKSVMSQSILRLLEDDSSVEYSGEILFCEKDILTLDKKQLQNICGNDISMVFQNPQNSLSPVHTISSQLTETLMLHKDMKSEEAKKKAVELLDATGIPSPKNCLEKYPFELSGGMLQRVMIAIALACEPKLLIADEPTTALDVTIQQQILKLIVDLNKNTNMAVLFITHDLGVVSQICDSVKVMYLGNIVEEASADELFSRPLHPYTKGLLSCIPQLDVDKNSDLPSIKGSVPPLNKIPKGCHFQDRCLQAQEMCTNWRPCLFEISQGHKVSCIQYEHER